MKTTDSIEIALVERARELTGIKRKSALVRAGLEALIQRESARCLAGLGGTMPEVKAASRRRSS